MASPRRLSLALLALGCAAGLLDCAGNADPTTTSSTTEALAATGGAAEMAQAAAANPARPGTQAGAADRFQLNSGDLHVTYDESVAGLPVLLYQDARQLRAFRGTEVQSTTTPAGKMVTVVIFTTIDTGFTTLSVLIPRVEVRANAVAPVETQAIVANHRLGAAASLGGQLDEYTFTPLEGSAIRASTRPASTTAELLPAENARPPFHLPPGVE